NVVVAVGDRHRLGVRAGCCQQQGGHHCHRLGFALGHVCDVLSPVPRVYGTCSACTFGLMLIVALRCAATIVRRMTTHAFFPLGFWAVAVYHANEEKRPGLARPVASTAPAPYSADTQHSRLICPIVSAPGCMPSSVARTPMRTPRRRAACATIWRGVRERISPR